MRLVIVVHLVGVLVRLFGPMLLVPARGRHLLPRMVRCTGFVMTALGTIALGHVMRRAGGATAEAASERLRRVEGMTIVAGSWLLMAHVAAVPYMWAGLGFIDALFESMSGLTTTGATVLRDFGLFGQGHVLLASHDAVARRDGRHRALRRGPAAAGNRRPGAVLRRGIRAHRRKADAAAQAHGTGALETVCRR